MTKQERLTLIIKLHRKALKAKGYKDSRLTHYSQGKRTPDYEDIKVFAKIAGVSENELPYRKTMINK